MTRPKISLAACVLMLAATSTQVAASAGGNAQSQSYNQGGWQAREGYGYPFFQPTSDLSLLQPHGHLLSWQKEKLLQWRAEALKRAQDDGGTLTASDRDYLHAKLDRILVP